MDSAIEESIESMQRSLNIVSGESYLSLAKLRSQLQVKSTAKRINSNSNNPLVTGDTVEV
jgi:hypothetical protein